MGRMSSWPKGGPVATTQAADYLAWSHDVTRSRREALQIRDAAIRQALADGVLEQQLAQVIGVPEGRTASSAAAVAQAGPQFIQPQTGRHPTFGYLLSSGYDHCLREAWSRCPARRSTFGCPRHVVWLNLGLRGLGAAKGRERLKSASVCQMARLRARCWSARIRR